jgi:hypothetical protein
MDAQEIDEQDVYQYYFHSLLPAITKSFPILISRLARDGTSLLWYYLTIFIEFLFPVWFRRWTAETTDTITRAAVESGEFISHWTHDLKNKSSGNATFVDYVLEKMDLNNDGKISTAEWSSNAEELKHEVELLMQQYYHAVTDKLHNQQSTVSWYSSLRSLVGKIIAVDWSMGVSFIVFACIKLIYVLSIPYILTEQQSIS